MHPVWKSKLYGAFVLNRRVGLHAIDATPARRRRDAGSPSFDGASTAASSPRNDLVENYRVHPTQWLIYTQVQSLPTHPLRRNATAGPGIVGRRAGLVPHAAHRAGPGRSALVRGLAAPGPHAGLVLASLRAVPHSGTG